MNEKPKILLVDDEEAIRLSGKYILDTWFSVTTTETTAKALEIIRKDRFDLILLDIMIRDEGHEKGIEALKIINEEYPDIPIVILSGSVTWMQKWDELKRLGASAFLNKPFGKDEIKSIVDSCLKKKP